MSWVELSNRNFAKHLHGLIFLTFFIQKRIESNLQSADGKSVPEIKLPSAVPLPTAVKRQRKGEMGEMGKIWNKSGYSASSFLCLLSPTVHDMLRDKRPTADHCFCLWKYRKASIDTPWKYEWIIQCFQSKTLHWWLKKQTIAFLKNCTLHSRKVLVWNGAKERSEEAHV